MPLENILYLSMVITAMVLFAAVLAYGEWVTRHAANSIRSTEGPIAGKRTGHNDDEPVRKAA